MSEFVKPVVLTGSRWVRLEPLTREHIPEIDAVAADGELGTLWYTMTPQPGAAEQWVERMLALRAADHGVSFVVRDHDGRLVGSSSYLNVDASNRRLEIGHTWYTAGTRGTGVNAEAKLLLLGHAFDELHCIAVEFRTHFFNFASRAAIERLGAKQDGVLRSHQIAADGSRRDTVVYSILDVEWPAVRSNLNFRLQRRERRA
jgi:RimJ/RimL family protein N-acetyltransferase